MTSSFIEILRFIISGAMMYQLAEEHKRPGGVRLSVEQLLDSAASPCLCRSRIFLPAGDARAAGLIPARAICLAKAGSSRGSPAVARVCRLPARDPTAGTPCLSRRRRRNPSARPPARRRESPGIGRNPGHRWRQATTVAAPCGSPRAESRSIPPPPARDGRTTAAGRTTSAVPAGPPGHGRGVSRRRNPWR